MIRFALIVAVLTGILLNVIETGKPSELNVNAEAQLVLVAE